MRCVPVCGSSNGFEVIKENERFIWRECQHTRVVHVGGKKQEKKCGHIDIDRKEPPDLPPPFYNAEEPYKEET